MDAVSSEATWGYRLAPFASIFDEGFVAARADWRWNPSGADIAAAGVLHVELASRVLTRPLGYSEGVAGAALASVFSLFETTRDVLKANPGCAHVDALVLHVLNRHVRPFTARWHRRSEAGHLEAWDATDTFRADLVPVRKALRRLDALLLLVRDGALASDLEDAPVDDRLVRMQAEFAVRLPWGVHQDLAGVRGAEDAAVINEAERAAVRARRDRYGIDPADDACGIALSGGGIRSATFSFGVLSALSRAGLMPSFDFMSSVSGGGYTASFLTAQLESEDPDVGLRSGSRPLRRGDAAFRGVRQECRYLVNGSLWGRLEFAAAQILGTIQNGLTLLLAAGVVGIADWLSRDAIASAVDVCTKVAVLLLLGLMVVLPSLPRTWSWVRRGAYGSIVALVVALVGLGVHTGLGWLQTSAATHAVAWRWVALVALVPVAASGFAAFVGRATARRETVVAVLSTLAVALVLLFAETATVLALDGPTFHGVPTSTLAEAIVGVAAAAVIFMDLNATSPHRYYRDRLAGTFLRPKATAARGGKDPVPRLSTLGTRHKGPVHLVNCALNVPASRDPTMRGRLTDFFVFSAAVCGSPLLGYEPTTEYERLDPMLDLATAMAISGAAAAPLMGTGTRRGLRFWLALLNVRLGYWLCAARRRKVKRAAPSAPPSRTRFVRMTTRLAWLAFWRSEKRLRRRPWFRPGLVYLWREMSGRVDEHSAYVNLSDGGHIENLGVYELLRRRVRFIVAVDGEEDRAMAFHALVALQRMATIDLGVEIDLDLDGLRLDERGLARTHFHLARIQYPERGEGYPKGVGYLLYLKLSVTGNESEFLRAYRTSQPLFPHHPTANQFFDEAQFEAYRALGEHVGAGLLLPALIGNAAVEAGNGTLHLERLVLELARSLLEPK